MANLGADNLADSGGQDGGQLADIGEQVADSGGHVAATMLSTVAVAARLGLSQRTILRRCESGSFVGAVRQSTGWVIPESALGGDEPLGAVSSGEAAPVVAADRQLVPLSYLKQFSDQIAEMSIRAGKAEAIAEFTGDRFERANMELAEKERELAALRRENEELRRAKLLQPVQPEATPRPAREMQPLSVPRPRWWRR